MLEALSQSSLANRISLGGAVGLMHYLEPLRPSPWVGVLLGSFADLVASKMVALVERGAPRDFRDIYELCQVQLANVDECWELWHHRQELVGSDTDLIQARFAVQLHLERIEKHRPLASISDFGERENASRYDLGFVRCLSMPQNNNWLDGTLYPDIEPPTEIVRLADRIDFLARFCSAWDFGLVPWPETVDEIRRAEWREAVEECRLLTSPAYHLLRRWHGLEPLPYLGQQLAYIRDDPNLAYV